MVAMVAASDDSPVAVLWRTIRIRFRRRNDAATKGTITHPPSESQHAHPPHHISFDCFPPPSLVI